LAEIRRDLEASPFVGEGHRKVWARLRRQRGIRTSRKRVLRLTREAGLLAPTPQVRKRSARLHEGTITVTVPDTLWATDATEAWRRAEGRCAVFVLVDHASNEVWYDAARRIDRFAAADLLREVCAERFGSVEQAVAAGLALRYDGGSCFRSDHYQAEIDHLGIARSPAFHYEPETNGRAEKAIQTLKEQLLWIERLDTLDELRTAVRAFGRTYNQHWLIERHEYRTPTEAREHLRAERPPRHDQLVHQSVRRTGAGGLVSLSRSSATRPTANAAPATSATRHPDLDPIPGERQVTRTDLGDPLLLPDLLVRQEPGKAGYGLIPPPRDPRQRGRLESNPRVRPTTRRVAPRPAPPRPPDRGRDNRCRRRSPGRIRAALRSSTRRDVRDDRAFASGHLEPPRGACPGVQARGPRGSPSGR
jgi:putative transposase